MPNVCTLEHHLHFSWKRFHSCAVNVCHKGSRRKPWKVACKHDNAACKHNSTTACKQNSRQWRLTGCWLTALPMPPVPSCHVWKPLVSNGVAVLCEVSALLVLLCNGWCSGEQAKSARMACAQACKTADLVQSAPILSLQICQIPNMAIIGNRQGCR